MLNLKRGYRGTAIALLVLLVSLSQLPFQISNVSAYDNNDPGPHEKICIEAIKLLPEGSDMFQVMWEQRSSLKWGAINEDETDVIYHIGGWAHDKTNPHFWDADEGLTDDVWCGTEAWPNAMEKAARLFDKALWRYERGEYEQAYRLLGRVSHLIADMSVPAHAHEDLHPGFMDVAGMGDDCYEDWFSETPSAQEAYASAETALAQGGVLKFPDMIAQLMREHESSGWEFKQWDEEYGPYYPLWDGGTWWWWGLFYLMYTTNQRADYFASDDYNGDSQTMKHIWVSLDSGLGTPVLTQIPIDWIDYTGWPIKPRVDDDLDDNDWCIAYGGDNDAYGHLSTIASYTVPYAIRAIAALYKMFYEITHPPTGWIDIVDRDGNNIADYQWVLLDLHFDVGAPEYLRDLEVRFRNEDEDWTDWEPYGATPGTRRVPWVLSHGDGSKTVYCQVRNLMGMITERSNSIELVEKGVPQTFDYTFTATGAANQPLMAEVSFTVGEIWIKRESGEEFVDFFFDPIWVDDGADHAHSAKIRYPSGDNYFSIDPDVWYGGQYAGSFPCARQIFSLSLIPGTKVRLRAYGWDDDFWENDPLSNVFTEVYTVPSADGIHDLCSGWFNKRSNGLVNQNFELWVWISAEIDWLLWSAIESGYTFVEYGKKPGVNEQNWVASSTLLAPADEFDPNPETTEWQVSIDNTAIEHEMIGPDLYAWTTGEPDMAVVAFSPVDLLITDPYGKKIGKEKVLTPIQLPDGSIWYLWTTVVTNEIPGASITSDLDLNGDGMKDTVFTFDEREVGDYQIQPIAHTGAEPTDTYSIGISSQQRKALGIPLEPSPRQVAYLVEDAQVSDIPAEPYIVQSTNYAVNLPPAADANGPYWATEGNAINFAAGGSTDPDGDALTYRWDFEDDGVWDTDWSSSPTASHTWIDDWTGTVRVEVNDGTFADNSTATVTVSNVAPTVNAGPNQFAAPGEELTFSGSLTDQGVADIHTISWNFSDGTIVNDTLTPTHMYSEAKEYTVTLTVTDDDGGVGKDTLTVNTAVEVSIDPALAHAPPGQSVAYNVLVHHLGESEDTYDLQMFGLDATWCALSTASVTLGPDQSESLTLTVSPPHTAIGMYSIGVTATSQTDPNAAATAYADVSVFPGRTIETCNSTGAKKDVFDIPEDLYVMGSGYSTSASYDLYVVYDVDLWTNGTAIPSRVSGTATSVTSDGDGNIPATPVWTSPLLPGKYDIIVDVDGDGIYNEEVDVLDDSDIQVTAGFFVIPEVPLGTITASAAMIITLLVYVTVTKRRRKQTYVNQ